MTAPSKSVIIYVLSSSVRPTTMSYT